MDTNPYASPSHVGSAGNVEPWSAVRGPATALIVVSIICLLVVSLDALFNPYLLLKMWEGVVLCANSIILMGAIRMRQMQSYSWAKTAAILAVVPCVGPCLLLGIPFGIWALLALGKPGVRESFR